MTHIYPLSKHFIISNYDLYYYLYRCIVVYPHFKFKSKLLSVNFYSNRVSIKIERTEH